MSNEIEEVKVEEEGTELLNSLKSDYTGAEILKNENDALVQKSMDIYNSKPYGNEEPNKSQYVSSMARQNASWQIPSIIEPFTSAESIVTCEPVTHNDTNTSEQAEKLLNYQATRNFNWFQFISELCEKTVLEGTCFVKTSWQFEQKEVTETITEQVPAPMDPVMQQSFQEQMQIGMQQAQANGQDPMMVQQEMMSQVPMQSIEKEVTRTKTIRNKPTSEICELVDLRVDPTCKGVLENAQFIIHDFETDLSTLKKDGRYKNLDKLEAFMDRDETYVDRDNVDQTFTFTDEARKKFIVHEYWGNYDLNKDDIAEPVVVCWVGDVIIREDDNPLDDGTKPFMRAVYDRKAGYIYGRSLPMILEDKQRIDSVLNRGIFDDMKRANNGQRGYKKGFTDETNRGRFKNGKDFEYNTNMADVWEGKYTSINQSVFNVMQMNRDSADASVGVRPFAHGQGGNSLGSTAAAVNATTTSSAKREMQIIRGIAEDCIIPMLRVWLAYDALFLNEEEVIRVTDGEFATIDRNDLDGNIDIKISIATQESKAMKADRLAFLMQTMGNNMPPEQSNLIMADLMEINDMPHLAEAIKNMPPPQPSPEQQEMMMLQKELLTAQVQNEYAKARENEIDYELKSAKRDFEIARARKMQSDADVTDLDFLRKDDGTDHANEMEKKNFDQQANEREKAQNNIAKYETERMKSQQKAAKSNDKKV